MENLWAIRRRKKMTVSDLAAKSGVPADLIRSYERGQQSIPTDHLERFAKVLYVDPWDINIISDAPPPSLNPPAQRQETPALVPPQPSPRPSGPKSAPPSRPARASQIEHLRGLLHHLGRNEEELKAELGKPLDELSQR